MKKLLSVALATTILTTCAPAHFASASKFSSDALAMNNLGLIADEKGKLSSTYLSQQATNALLSTILLKLNLLSCEELDALSPEDALQEATFYSIFLKQLGYEANQTTSLDLAQSIGLNPTFTEGLTIEALSKALNDCLKAKTKLGREYFEVLIENGFLSDYNANKKVPEILIFDGKTQPIFNHDEAIYEMVYVESPQDTDLDGKRDLIEVWIKRPKETTAGMKVPAVFEISPYLQGTNDDLYIVHDVDEDLTIGEPSSTTLEDVTFTGKDRIVPKARKVKGTSEMAEVEAFDFGGWYNYFFARGYAVVFSGGIGTYGSEGLTSCGSEEETISTVAIIDWLNGRTRAFTNKTDQIEVKADWCTGNVGMSGRSYRGTLPIAAATTGVKGLKTIVPIAAISSWYDYYRANGLNVAGEGWQGDDCDLLATYCLSRMLDPKDYEGIRPLFETSMEEMRQAQDRISGDYNVFWDERNYLNHADQIKASVFIVQGLNDWNVKTTQADLLWKKLQQYNVPSKMVLHQGEHISIDNLAGIDFNDIMNEWFAYWLYDIDNEVMKEVPTALIQNNTTMAFEGFNSWPITAQTTKVYFNDNTLNLTPVATASNESFTDDLSLSGYDRVLQDGSVWRDALVLSPETVRADRLAYLTPSLSKETRLSGTVKLSLTASLDQPTGIISAMLVDYGKDYRATIDTEVIMENGIIYGGNAGSDDFVDFVMSDVATDYKVITRGWMDAQNRLANYKADPLTPGENYTFELNLTPMDYTLKAGHKLGLILYSTDAEYTMRPLTITNFTINPSESYIEIPFTKTLKSW